MIGYGRAKAEYNFWPEDFPRLESTADCARAYGELRLAGAVPDREARERLMESPQCLDADRVLHDTGMADSGKGKLSRPVECLRQLDPGAFTERQETGDCVSHGLRNCGDLTRACDIVILKQPEIWIARGATENLYGARGWSGQGANCSTLANYAHKQGGFLVRKNYQDLGIDLSQYNAVIGDRWGGRGVPAAVTAEGAKHQLRYLARVQTWEQARDFAANGYGLFWCAGIAYSEDRDANGVAGRTRGGWSHSQAMGLIFDDTDWAHQNYDGPLIGIAQSWGAGFASGGWNTERYGAAHGSLSLLRVSVLNEVLRNGDVWALGDFNGFEKRIDRLPDWGATEYLGTS